MRSTCRKRRLSVAGASQAGWFVRLLHWSLFTLCSVTTYPGWPQTWKTWNTHEFLGTWKSQGILWEFCATSRENCNKQSSISLSFKYLLIFWIFLSKVLGFNFLWISDMVRVRWWPVLLLELMWNDRRWRSLLRALFAAITYGKVSLWLWKSVENSGGIFFVLCGHRVLSPESRPTDVFVNMRQAVGSVLTERMFWRTRRPFLRRPRVCTAVSHTRPPFLAPPRSLYPTSPI